MKKYGIALIAIFFMVSCTSTKSVSKKPLYEMLTSSHDGGANIQFYEILTEPKEIKMLLGDPALAEKIKNEDLNKSNFIILNMGGVPEGNYTISVEKIEETQENIIVYVKESKPQGPAPIGLEEYIYPYSVVKINSKKPIVIK